MTLSRRSCHHLPWVFLLYPPPWALCLFAYGGSVFPLRRAIERETEREKTMVKCPSSSFAKVNYNRCLENSKMSSCHGPGYLKVCGKWRGKKTHRKHEKHKYSFASLYRIRHFKNKKGLTGVNGPIQVQALEKCGSPPPDNLPIRGFGRLIDTLWGHWNLFSVENTRFPEKVTIFFMSTGCLSWIGNAHRVERQPFWQTPENSCRL